MPITAWTCPSCNQTVPLDHFAVSTCGSKIHPDFAAAVLADRELQEGRDGVRVSMGLSCPRKAALTAAVDVAVDPLGMLSPLKGTAWHSLMDASAKADGFGVDAGKDWLGSEVEVSGIIAGVPLSGRIDRVRLVGGKLVGEDHKTGSDFRVRHVKPSAKTPDARSPLEYRIQLSLYAELYRQQFSKQWDIAAIWWWFSNDCWPEPVAIIPVAECLSHKPYSADYTVEQLLQQAHAVTSGAVKWSDLPLVGQSITFGTMTGCDYCAVRGVCWEQHMGAPF